MKSYILGIQFAVQPYCISTPTRHLSFMLDALPNHTRLILTLPKPEQNPPIMSSMLSSQNPITTYLTLQLNQLISHLMRPASASVDRAASARYGVVPASWS